MKPASAPQLGRALTIALGATLVLLLAHAWIYRFQCDDAFISFRYARNFADGFGLVFNPGFEAVEGYTNFLWVVVLAAFSRMGIAPEQAADPLSLLATIVLWALVARFAWQRRPDPPWLVVVPVLLLAATRSVAVWSTSGLETRWYEMLVVAGVLRLVVEVERMRGDGRAPHAVAGWLLALATLTRPDGLVVAGSVLGVAVALLAPRGRLALRWLRGTLVPYALLVGGHYLFRRLYYGDWLPNTYYAKVDGQTWWNAGIAYVSAFALEYAVYLWVPLLAAAVVWHRRRGSGHVPLLFAAAVLPHALYVTAIGGDHFEYRALDLYFPFAFLLIADGIGVLARSRARAWGAAACLLLLLFGLWQLPWQSHRQFPDHYISGFPGVAHRSHHDHTDYLDPDHDPVYGLPGLRSIAEAHHRLVDYLTARFVAIRQEEHRLFLDMVTYQSGRLRALLDQGILPRDLRLAISCVGAIPYDLDVYTLDRLGLTDARVARSPVAVPGVMAHGKLASFDYAREREVDLWAVDPVHPVVSLVSARLLAAAREPDAVSPVYAMDVGNDEYLLCQFPLGLEHALERMPAARFESVNDPAFIGTYITRATAAFENLLSREPGNLGYWRRLAFLIMVQRRFPEALEIYRRLTAAQPGNADAWENMGLCQQQLGDLAAAIASSGRALSLYREAGDTDSERRLVDRLDALRAAAPPGE